MSFVAPAGGSSGGGLFQRPQGSSSSGRGPTQLQLLQLLWLAQQKQHHRGFFGKIIHGAAHGLESGLKFISRPSYAVAGAADEIAQGHGLGGALHGAHSGITGHPHGFGQVLSDAGVLKGHNFTRGALGLVGDIITDPTMLLSIAAAPETLGGSLSLIAAKEASMGLTRGTLVKAGDIALGKEAASLGGKKIARDMLARAGDDFKWQKELLDTRLRLGGKFTHEGDRFELNRLESAAHEEQQVGLGAKKIQPGFKVPFGPQLRVNTHIPAPTMGNIAGRTGVRVAGAAPIMDAFGRAFVHGWKNESDSAYKMATEHVVENLNQRAFAYIRQGLRPFLLGKNKLSHDEMKNALAGAITSPRQQEFVDAWKGVKKQFAKDNKKFNKYDVEFLHNLDEIVLKNPKQLKGALIRQKNAGNPDFVQEFSHAWQKATGKWKLGVTVINPGYRIRNTLSDFWNMYVSGVPLWAMPTYAGKAAMTLRKVAAGKGTTAEKQFVEEASAHSVKAGFFHTDVVPAAKHLHDSNIRHPLATIARTAAHMNQNAEDWGRMTHYLYLRQHLHMNAAEAGARIRETHFDYERLTRFEKNLKGSIAPFYTWTRKNIPFQIKMMFKNPGRYSAFQKMRDEMNTASGGQSKLVPSWMRQQMAFAVPFGGKHNMMIPQFGPTDIEKLQHPTQMAGLITPGIKTPLELLMNRSFLTGAPLYGSANKHPRTPVSRLGKDILRFVPGANVGTTARNINDKMVRGPGASPIAAYLAGQTPISNLLVNQTSNIKSAQRGGQSKALLSWLGGTSTFNVNEAQQAKVLSAQEKDAFAQYVRGLRDEGKLPESKRRKKSKFQQELDRIIKQGGNGY